MNHLSPLFIGAQTVERESLGAGSTSRFNSKFEFPGARSPSRQPRSTACIPKSRFAFPPATLFKFQIFRCRFAFPPTARCHVAYPARGELRDTWRTLRHVANYTTTLPRTSEYPCSRPLSHLSDVNSPSPTAGWGMHPWTRPAQRCWGGLC
ncbi:hypothetical protein TIFTF001_053926 [Ficus carica]|uniref:Uncharacterized protein n=1 Tax=Ficus carica TaxID=3494 RepID=A0AA88EJF2_FICCA|nr:hypothetical protein TIFTF001_053926 [Ficus carica]